MTEIKNNTSSSDISSMSSSCLTRGSRNKDIHSTGFPVKRGMTKDLESGRSMVEMLGVLAIVGVLSVGGIAGYTYAMNKHYANELLNGASQRAVILKAQKAAGLDLSLREFDGVKVAGGEFSPDVLEPDGAVGIAVSGVKGAVCENLIKATEGTDIAIAKDAGVLVNDITEEECDNENDNNLVFVFETGLGGAGDGAKDVCENGNPYLSYMDDPCGTEWAKPTCSSDNECMDSLYDSCCHPDLGICVEAESCEWDDNNGEKTCVCKDISNKCTSNSNCDSGEFCNLKSFENDNGDDSNSPTYGTCDDIGEVNVSGNLVSGSERLTWWAAENWCKAQEASMLKFGYEGMGDCIPGEVNGDCDDFISSHFGEGRGYDGFWLGNMDPSGKAYRIRIGMETDFKAPNSPYYPACVK